VLFELLIIILQSKGLFLTFCELKKNHGQIKIKNCPFLSWIALGTFMGYPNFPKEEIFQSV